MRVNDPFKGLISGGLHHAIGCGYRFGEDTVALLYAEKTALPDTFSRRGKTARRGSTLQSRIQVDPPCFVVHVKTRQKEKDWMRTRLAQDTYMHVHGY